MHRVTERNAAMPSKPKRPCNKPGCRNLTNERFCAEHMGLVHKADRWRGSAAKRGYGHKWRKERLDYLADNPLCVECKDAGEIVAATVVDHIIPHKGDQKLFWRRSNWQGLCEMHHNSKTAREDGGSW